MYYCDYPFYKFEDEITNYFEGLYSPLVKNLEKNKEWKILIRPKMSSFYVSQWNVPRHYQTWEETLKNTNYYIYLLINEELTPQTEREYNSFMYDFRQTIEDRVGYQDDFFCYYSTKYFAAEVSDQDLLGADFSTRDGIFVPNSL